MLRRDQQIRTQIHLIADGCIFLVSFLTAYLLRSDPRIIAWLGPPPNGAFQDFVKLFFLVPAAALILEWQGFYERPPLSPRRVILWPLLKGCALATAGLVLVTYLFHLQVPRVTMIGFGCISLILVYLKEELVLLFLKSKMAKLQYHRRFIIAGTGKEIAETQSEIKARGDEGIEIVAQLDLDRQAPQELVQMLHEHSVYGVILSARRTYFEQIENVIRACEVEGVEVWLMADFFATQISRTSFDEMLGRPLLIFRTTPESSWHSVAKWLMDEFGSLTLLILLTIIPVIPVIALLVKITSPGPIFFRQQRSGQNGRPFTLYKFRTMVTNAEQYRHELEAMNEMSGPVFKLTNDPRVTPIGKFLRKYSLDELPQLWNVLRGEMSLVGPRPLPVDEVKRFSDLAHRRRLSVKPGLTCLWQIGGRNQIFDFKDWVRLDLEYIDNWSLWLDLKILLYTIPAVFRGTGAK